MFKIHKNLKDNCIIQRIKIICWHGATFAPNYCFLSQEVWLLNNETIFKKCFIKSIYLHVAPFKVAPVGTLRTSPY